MIGIAYSFGLSVLLRLYVRATRFKDWGAIANLRAVPPAKWARAGWRLSQGDRKEYEVMSEKRDSKAESIIDSYLDNRGRREASHLITGADPWAVRDRVAGLCVSLMGKTAEEVNYVCVGVSPFDIWLLITKNAKKYDIAISEIKKRLVFIDCYTNAFGFRDEVLIERVRQMRVTEHLSVISCDSTSSIHTGTSKAFKILKKKATEEERSRRPCTMVYDTISLLSIPETADEVAEFVVHVSAAETAYGMVTMFLEPNMEARQSPIVDVIQACCGTPSMLVSQEMKR